MTFTVVEPTAPESPLVVEIPHAGLDVDALAMATLAAPVRFVGVDADLYVDELYQRAPEFGATTLVSHVSRYVCDLNRGEADFDSLAGTGGRAPSAPHGLFWRCTTEDQPALFAPLTASEVERRLRDIYRPYHATLSDLLIEKRKKFGFAVLLCAHSMPSTGRSGHADPGTPRADVVPGSRGRTSASSVLIDVPDALARSYGFSVAHDTPYRGGFSTAHYGRPAEGFHAVQVELARRLYMNEDTLEKVPAGFSRTTQFATDLVEILARTRP